MWVLTKLLPKTLEEINSPINGKISVIEWFGRKKIVVNKLTQSGPIMEEIWEAAIKYRETVRLLRRFTPRNDVRILVLGLGGGSIIKVLQKKIPNAKITAVDLDPEMIRLGEKHLGFKKDKNLKIVIDDAVEYLKNKNGLFDLVFIDLFKGDKIPKSVETKKFLTEIKKILKENGVVVFNRHYYQNHIFEAKIFLDKIKGIFNDVNIKRILTNLIIFCKK